MRMRTAIAATALAAAALLGSAGTAAAHGFDDDNGAATNTDWTTNTGAQHSHDSALSWGDVDLD